MWPTQYMLEQRGRAFVSQVVVEEVEVVEVKRRSCKKVVQEIRDLYKQFLVQQRARIRRKLGWWSRYFADWTCKTRLVKLGLVKRGLVKRGLANEEL